MNIECKINNEDILEVAKATFPKKTRIVTHLANLIIILFVSINIIFKKSNIATVTIIILIGILGILCIELYLKNVKEKYCKLFVDRWKEGINGETKSYLYQFDDTNISITNLETSGKLSLPYDSFLKYIETKHFALFITHASTFIIFEKEVAVKNNIAGFVLMKNPNLNVK